jgi:RimJ/RimL family protein N-acetyltransferase
LTTARLVLEPLTGEHAALLWSSMQDPAIYEWISMTAPTSVAVLKEHWDETAVGYLSPNGVEAWLGWAVRRTADGVYIGKADAVVDDEDIATNVGYLYFPWAWGQGYATEATIAVAEHLARMGVVEQRATVTVGNHASGRVLEKAGFVRTGILKDNDLIRGVKHDDILYVRRS